MVEAGRDTQTGRTIQDMAGNSERNYLTSGSQSPGLIQDASNTSDERLYDGMKLSLDTDNDDDDDNDNEHNNKG